MKAAENMPVEPNYYREARRLYLSGKLDDSFALFEKAVEQEPGNRKIRADYGQLLIRVGHLDAGITQLEKALELGADETVKRKLDDARARLSQPAKGAKKQDTSPKSVLINARQAYKSGDIDTAFALFEKAIELDSGNPRLHTEYGLALVRARDYASGARHLEQAVSLGAGPAVKAKLDDAVERRDRSGERERQFPESVQLLRKARQFYREGNTEEAFKLFDRVLELEAGDAKLHVEYARILNRHRDIAGAVDHFAKAVELGADESVRSQLVDAQEMLRRKKLSDKRGERERHDINAEVDAFMSGVHARVADSATPFAKHVLALDPVEKGDSKTDHTKVVYEEHWGRRLTRVLDKVKQGEHISHIIRSMRPYPHAVAQRSRISRALSDYYLADLPTLTGTDIPVGKVDAVDGRYTVTSNIDPIVVIFQRAAKADYIVELGSGPGWNLFDLAVSFGREVRNRRLFALEYTQAGIDATRELAKVADGVNVTAVQFDYTKPDLSMIPDDKPALIFSQHSIEQVEDISPDLYEQIIARKAPTELLHFEPIGWQRYKGLLDARYANDVNVFRAIVEKRYDHLDGDISVAINSAINSWRTGYNRNCLGLVDKFAAEGKIKVLDRIYDFTNRMVPNPTVPSTYLRIVPNRG